MRKILWLSAIIPIFIGVAATLSLGQAVVPGTPTTGKPPAASPPRPPVPSVFTGGKSTAAPAPVKPARDLTQLPPLQRQTYLSVQRGTAWLQRACRSDGRFVHGLVPALRAPLEGDNYLCQIAAAFTLARAGHLLKEERPIALARQALLTLLLDTDRDPQQPTVRRPALPGSLSQRLAAASWLLLAIHQLPEPGADLVEQAEELAQFIRLQQRTDGAFVASSPTPGQTDSADPESACLALYALSRSLHQRQADWKLEAVRKGRAHYFARWRENRDPSAVSWLSAVSAELSLLTKEQACTESLWELNDWLCGLQYQQVQPQRLLWLGGFQKWQDGKVHLSAPDVQAAGYLEGLCQACRVARQVGDLPRYQRYHATIERCLHFLSSLQYTEANIQHFAEWYRPQILGAFHGSHQDGNLRLDYTQQAVCAMLKYLQEVAEIR